MWVSIYTLHDVFLLDALQAYFFQFNVYGASERKNYVSMLWRLWYINGIVGILSVDVAQHPHHLTKFFRLILFFFSFKLMNETRQHVDWFCIDASTNLTFSCWNRLFVFVYTVEYCFYMYCLHIFSVLSENDIKKAASNGMHSIQKLSVSLMHSKLTDRHNILF